MSATSFARSQPRKLIICNDITPVPNFQPRSFAILKVCKYSLVYEWTLQRIWTSVLENWCSDCMISRHIYDGKLNCTEFCYRHCPKHCYLMGHFLQYCGCLRPMFYSWLFKFKFKRSLLLHKKIHITSITGIDSSLVHCTEFIGRRQMHASMLSPVQYQSKSLTCNKVQLVRCSKTG